LDLVICPKKKSKMGYSEWLRRWLFSCMWTRNRS
jgi:hypothetical protein